MNSTWTGLCISTRGLFSSKAGLLVTNNNISNSNTKGYSRQEVNQVAVTPAAIYNSKYMIGSGSEVESVIRARNDRLDQKYWQENSDLGVVQAKSDMLKEVESIFGEADNKAFTKAMTDFNSALESVSTDPGSSSARKSLQQKGKNFCEYLNSTSKKLTQLREGLNTEVKSTAEQINSYASQIATLNSQIRAAAGCGASTNDLKDQRTLLLDKLSKLTDITVNQAVVGKLADGSDDIVLSVNAGGVTLVNNDKCRQLECYQNADGMYGVRWQDTKEAFTPEGGELKAALELRDGTGTNADYKGIPYYLNQLDNYAQTLAKVFNEGGSYTKADGSTTTYPGHAGGYGLPAAAGATAPTGNRFFSYDSLTGTGLDYSKITAANISLSKEVLDNTNNIAAADAVGGTDNAKNIDSLIDLLADSNMYTDGTPTDHMGSIITTLGVASDYSDTMSKKQSSFVNTIDTRRKSVSGVSSNEETANLTKYEEAYNASAIMVNTWSSIYKTTIDMVSDS